MDLQAKIDELDEKIKALKIERSEYVKMQQYTPSNEVLRLVETVRANPGINRKKLEEIHPEIENVSYVLTSAGRNFGLIENLGTRSQPSWHIVAEKTCPIMRPEPLGRPFRGI